jgi:hypothetical protein
MVTRLALPLVLLPVVSGCVTATPTAGPPVTLEQVIRQIKSDIGAYNDYARAHEGDVPQNDACGGKIDLTIEAVTVNVTTVTKLAEGGSAGAELSPNPIIKISGGVGRSLSNESSQTLSFTLVPVAGSNSTPVASSRLYLALKDLRESLLRASNATPCLSFPTGDQDNSVEFGFQATQSTTNSLGANLFIFAFGYSRGDERTAAHSVKIAFKGVGQSFVQ